MHKLIRFKAFTMIELIVVLSVVSILVGITAVAYTGWRSRLAQTQIKNDLIQITSAMDSAKIFSTGYPTTLPTSYTPTTGTTLTLVSSSGDDFCIDAKNTSNSLNYYVRNSTNKNSPQSGSCLGDYVTSGLVMHLDAGSLASYPGTGSTWYDLSGNSRNATLVNGVGYSASNGGAMVFDGSNDYATTVFGGNFPTGSSQRSLCAVFNATSLTGGKDIVGIGGNTVPGSRSALWLGASGAIGVETMNSTVSTTDWPGVNNWVYLCGVFPSGATSNFSFKIYINGVEKTTTTSGSSATLNTTTTASTIGSVPDTTTEPVFAGKIAQVSIYNRALSASEVLQNFNALKSRFGL